MKKLIVLFLSLILCFSFLPSYAEDIESDQYMVDVDVIPEPTPRPDWGVSISSSVDDKSQVFEGTEVTLRANLYNFRNEDSYYIEWLENDGSGWYSVGGNSTTYSFIITRENARYKWRVIVHID